MLSNQLKVYRKEAGYSQEKLAELLGVSRQAVAKWESGQSMPSTDNLIRLAQIFSVPVEMLLSNGEKPPEDMASAVKKPRRTNLVFFMAAIGAYLLVYLVGRLLCSDLTQNNIMGILFGTDSKYYLFGWLLTSRLFWCGVFISVLPALWGKYRYTAVTIAGFVFGIFWGEWLGPYPAGEPWGSGHYGWALWIGVFLVSVISGCIWQKLKSSQVTLRSPKGRYWLICTILAYLFITWLILSARVVPAHG